MTIFTMYKLHNQPILDANGLHDKYTLDLYNNINDDKEKENASKYRE